MRLASLLSLVLLACGPAGAAIDVAPGIDFAARVDSTTRMPIYLAARPQDDKSEHVSAQREQSEADRVRKAKAKARQPSAGAAAQPYQALVDHVQETTDDFRDQNVSEGEERDRLKDPPPPL